MNKYTWTALLPLLFCSCMKQNPMESPDTDSTTAGTDHDTDTNTDTNTSSDSSSFLFDTATHISTDSTTTIDTDSNIVIDTMTINEDSAIDSATTDTLLVDTENNDHADTNSETTPETVATDVTDSETAFALDTEAETTTETATATETSETGDTDNDSNIEESDTDLPPLCTALERRCHPDLEQPQLCDEFGNWQNQPACPYVCKAGFCTGECRPTEIHCNEATNLPQLCNSEGQWVNQPECQINAVCSAGECVCTGGLLDCSGICVDISINADHCGKCEHSCLGGTCVDESCQPVVMADTIDINSYLGISDTHVYELNDFNMREFYANRIPKSGGKMAPYIAQGANTTIATVIPDGSVFWDAYDTIDQSGRLYCYPDSITIFAEQLEKPVEHIVVKDGMIYWDQIFSDHTEIFARPADHSKESALIVNSDYVIDSFTVAGDCVYVDGVNHLVRYCSSKDTGEVVYAAPTALYIQEGPPDGNYIYFRSIGEGILRISTEAPFEPELISSVVTTDVVVASDGTLYYIDGDSGGAPACTTNWGIYKLDPSSPNDPVTLIPPPMACPGKLKVDDNAIYWINYNDSTLLKLAR